MLGAKCVLDVHGATLTSPDVQDPKRTIFKGKGFALGKDAEAESELRTRSLASRAAGRTPGALLRSLACTMLLVLGVRVAIGVCTR